MRLPTFPDKGPSFPNKGDDGSQFVRDNAWDIPLGMDGRPVDRCYRSRGSQAQGPGGRSINGGDW